MNIEEIKNKILPLLKKYGVKKAGLFGSLVRGEAMEDSDVDILVDLPKGASLLDLVGLKIELEDELERKVDVLTYNSIYHLLREPILNEQVEIL
ncbi:MAG: nucleotidyltransferase family protein [Candidatus Brocadiales bacterium]